MTVETSQPSAGQAQPDVDGGSVVRAVARPDRSTAVPTVSPTDRRPGDGTSGRVGDGASGRPGDRASGRKRDAVNVGRWRSAFALPADCLRPARSTGRVAGCWIAAIGLFVGRATGRHGRDAGMTTAEYAVGTIAACAFAAVLFKVVTSGAVLGLLQSVVTRALHAL